jgi:signal transduction histidine kinase
MIAFVVGGLVLTAGLAVATYVLSQRYLLGQRERSATRQAFLDARLVRDTLSGDAQDPAAALDRLELSPRSQAAFARRGQWFATSVAVGPKSLPPHLRGIVDSGHAVHQRVTVLGEPRLVVGVPLRSVDGAYYEVFDLGELRKTLSVIRNSLIAAAGVTVVGAALLGFWASRRVLRPLRGVNAAAARIAAGDFSARLAVQGDPDLDSVTVSFNTMVDALEQRIERDARFVSDVSHELRSPLTTLAAAAEVLQARMDAVPERSRAALELVVDEIQRFHLVVEELLELSRTQAGADPIHPEPVFLGELVLHVATRYAGRPFAIEVEPVVAEHALLLDKRRVERVLVNLLENARAHGGGPVLLHAVRRDDMVRLEVDDAGAGVPLEERDLIFERFARGRRAGSRGDDSGSGLGLALVAEHVRLHGGSVWVEDRPGGGARFVVELPWTPA